MQVTTACDPSGSGASGLKDDRADQNKCTARTAWGTEYICISKWKSIMAFFFSFFSFFLITKTEKKQKEAMTIATHILELCDSFVAENETYQLMSSLLRESIS